MTTDFRSQVTFTPEVLTEFKIEYDKAHKAAYDSFTFGGQIYYTPYAKYLIEYLESQFNNPT